MALKTRAEFFDLETAIDTARLYPTSRLVSSITGMHVPRNKAIVGENAFAHEAGIHQHGMLQHASTYEIMRPEDVRELGFDLDEFETNRAFQEFKKLADRKKDVYDSDIEAIVMNADSTSPGPWVLASLQVNTCTDEDARAGVTLRGEDGDAASGEAQGDGPIAAAFLALEKATGVDLVLRNFEVHSTSVGEDAQGEVTVTVEHEGASYRGHGTSVDIVEAGARAYLEVINRVLRRQQGDTALRSSPGGASRATI